METNPSKEKLPARDSHPAWHVAGWLVAMLAVLAATTAVVMARTHAVSAERSRRTTVAEKGPHVLVTRGQNRIRTAPTDTSSHDPGLCGNPGLRQDPGISKGDSGR